MRAGSSRPGRGNCRGLFDRECPQCGGDVAEEDGWLICRECNRAERRTTEGLLPVLEWIRRDDLD